MIITDIQPQKKKNERVNIHLDGAFYCALELETVVKAKLKIGDEISKERLDEIQLENEKLTALDRAYKLLSRCRKTEKEMRIYLYQKGYKTPVVKYVLLRLQTYGFLNDESYAQAFYADNRAKKGLFRIRLELKEKGVDENTLEEVFSEEEDDVDAAFALAERHFRGKDLSDPKEQQRLYRYLAGRGYQYETISLVRSRLTDGDEDA